jgi:mycoredoxin
MDKNMEIEQTDKIIVYGTPWCGDCYRSHKLLQEAGMEYVDINIDQDAEAAEKVIQINNGYRSVPTIVFPDGAILVEPSNTELVKALENYQNTVG